MMFLHLENVTHCEDVQCFRPWVFQVGLCTILVFLIEAQLSYAGVFVSLPSTAHCSCLMNRENKPRTHHDEGAEQHGLDPLGALMPALHKR